MVTSLRIFLVTGTTCLGDRSRGGQFQPNFKYSVIVESFNVETNLVPCLGP